MKYLVTTDHTVKMTVVMLLKTDIFVHSKACIHNSPFMNAETPQFKYGVLCYAVVMG